MDFQKAKQELLATVDDLRKVASKSVRKSLNDKQGIFANRLNDIESAIRTQRFTVGVVGVFNTGKSMLLNALMKRDLLSCHILPETATITTLYYSENDTATVQYWTLKEWQQIEAQIDQEAGGKGDPEATRIVRETKEALGKKFDDYVTAKGRTDKDIPLIDLKKYTSANGDEQLSRLVREIDIGTTLDLCKDNIAIVDTPGLNDPIQLREHITVEKFLPRCDLLLLLLPATMVFTDFDRRFLKRQLDKGQIHKLIAVINQIDRLDSREEAEIVVKWARKEIEKALSDNNGTAKSRKTAPSVEIFPVAARQSFLNRVGKTEEAKWSDEESGVPVFENRLREFLFEGERAREMQTIFVLRLSGLVEEQLIQLEQRLGAVDLPLLDFEKKLEAKRAQATEILNELERVREGIRKEINHFEHQFDAQVEILSREIPQRASQVEDKAMAKLDDFLDKGVWTIVTEIKTWSRDEFEPFLKETIRQEVDEAVSHSMRTIERQAQETLEECKKAYQMMMQRIKLGIPDIENPENYAKIVGNAVLGAGVGLAMREALIGLMGTLSAYLAGLLAGPIGWVIIGVATIWQTIRGGERIKERCRAEMRANLPREIRKALDQVVKDAKPSLQELRGQMLQQIKEEAEKPAIIIEEKLEQEQNDLEELQKRKESKAFDIEKERQTLTKEMGQLGEIRNRLSPINKTGV